jgi:hypothetical protein
MARFRPRIPRVQIHLMIAIALLIATGFLWLSGCENGVAIDQEALTGTAEPEQQTTPEATLAAEPATSTPSPTETAVPPTAMPLPTETAVPPTATPLPTETAVPPTATPLPTETAVPPTATPVPTSAPAPTETLTLTPDPAVSYLLPDLQVLPPAVLYIEADSSTGKKEIRFDTTTINMGDGPLVMRGSLDEEENGTRVTQVLIRKDGGQDAVEIGTFLFHPDHDHWHFEDFAEMQMYSLNEDQSLAELITTTGKITSCVHDLHRLPSPPPNSPTNGPYAACGQDIQGLSVGWADTYSATLPGQQVDIRGVPDGRYALRLVVNPSERIIELDYENNTATILVEIEGTSISRVSD